MVLSKSAIIWGILGLLVVIAVVCIIVFVIIPLVKKNKESKLGSIPGMSLKEITAKAAEILPEAEKIVKEVIDVTKSATPAASAAPATPVAPASTPDASSPALRSSLRSSGSSRDGVLNNFRGSGQQPVSRNNYKNDPKVYDYIDRPMDNFKTIAHLLRAYGGEDTSANVTSDDLIVPPQPTSKSPMTIPDTNVINDTKHDEVLLLNQKNVEDKVNVQLMNHINPNETTSVTATTMNSIDTEIPVDSPRRTCNIYCDSANYSPTDIYYMKEIKKVDGNDEARQGGVAFFTHSPEDQDAMFFTAGAKSLANNLNNRLAGGTYSCSYMDDDMRSIYKIK